MRTNMNDRYGDELDPYAVLGVPTNATTAEIKSAYRSLARKFHPDKVDGGQEAKAAASAKFSELASAYDVLTDERKRWTYDNVHGIDNGAYGSGTSTFRNPEVSSQTEGHKVYSQPYRQNERKRAQGVGGFCFSFTTVKRSTGADGVRKTVATTTSYVNGERIVNTETTSVFPDGRREVRQHSTAPETTSCGGTAASTSPRHFPWSGGGVKGGASLLRFLHYRLNIFCGDFRDSLHACGPLEALSCGIPAEPASMGATMGRRQ